MKWGAASLGPGISRKESLGSSLQRTDDAIYENKANAKLNNQGLDWHYDGGEEFWIGNSMSSVVRRYWSYPSLRCGKKKVAKSDRKHLVLACMQIGIRLRLNWPEHQAISVLLAKDMNFSYSGLTARLPPISAFSRVRALYAKKRIKDFDLTCAYTHTNKKLDWIYSRTLGVPAS